MDEHFLGWRKSRHSDPNGDCVEVARTSEGTIGVRDSKASRPVLELDMAHWRAFMQAIRSNHH